MSLIKKNIAANMVGSVWIAAASIAFIPLYIHFLGVEGYGLVGFYVTLQAVFAMLDLGLTATLSRELARLEALGDKAREMIDLVRTLELIYWLIAFCVGLVIVLSAPWIASMWLNANQLPVSVIEESLILIGIVIALRLPYGFYCGGLIGLQRQVQMNIIKIIMETLKSAGVVLVLWLYSPTIQVFFQWQLLVGVVALVTVMIALWRLLPMAPYLARFRKSIFSNLFTFTAGLSGIALLSTALVQSDKMVLSNMLSLQDFAHYMLASTLAMGLYVIVSPIFSAVYPRFTELFTQNRPDELTRLYHNSCQFIGILILPLALVLSFFSQELIQFWIRDAELSSQVAPILSVLIIGSALNGLMTVPYALQLAHGWTSLALKLNLVAIIILIPLLVFVASTYGAAGAAFVWLLLNAGYILFGIRLMHKKILLGEAATWVINSLIKPVVAVLPVILLSRVLLSDSIDGDYKVIWVGVTYLTAMLIAIFSTSSIRIYLMNKLSRGAP